MIGQEYKGLEQMFVFMNTARIGTALQGLGTCCLVGYGIPSVLSCSSSQRCALTATSHVVVAHAAFSIALRLAPPSGAAELALQGALPYARDRGSMRAVSGTKAPEKVRRCWGRSRGCGDGVQRQQELLLLAFFSFLFFFSCFSVFFRVLLLN